MHSHSELWRDNTLHIPRDVNETYESILKRFGLYERAIQFRGQSGIHGGESENETNAHFACLFLNSVSRVQYLLLDPKSEFSPIPHDLILTLSSHRISILDLPCGAGAGTISLIATIKELRRFGILPTNPLTVSIIGADISKSALAIFEIQISLLKPSLSEFGINVTFESHTWNAKDVRQTNDLLDIFLEAQGINEHIVLVANFSGATKKQEDFNEFSLSFQQIWIRMSSSKTRKTTILWVEPEGDTPAKLVSRLKSLLNPFSWFQSKIKSDSRFKVATYSFFHKLQNKSVGSGVTVQSYSRD